MELVELVNNHLKNGGSISKFERENGYGKDTVRKQLNKIGYVYKKDIKQFVLQDNTNITQVQNKSKKSNNKNKLKQSNDKFDDEEIQILKEIIYKYKNKNKDENFDGEIVTRSFRTYKNVLDNFVKYCKENRLKQQDAIAQALKNFYSENEK